MLLLFDVAQADRPIYGLEGSNLLKPSLAIGSVYD